MFWYQNQHLIIQINVFEKDTFTPESEPHVSKNTFVQNPGPLPQVQPLASAQAKPPVTKAVPDVTSLKHLQPVQVHLPATSTSSLSSMNKSERSARYVSALAKHYFDVLNTKAIDSGWLEPPRPKRKKSKKYWGAVLVDFFLLWVPSSLKFESTFSFTLPFLICLPDLF